MQKCSRTILLSLVCLVLSACSNVPLARELPMPAVTSALTTQEITPENVAGLTEVARLAVDNAGPVAALTFTPDMQTLLVAYAREGQLRHWRLADNSLLRTLDVHPVELGGVAFDAAGNQLATSAGVEWEAHRFEDEYLGWQVWDVQTGSIVKRLGKTYDSVLTRELYPDILLSPDGRRVLMISASADKNLWYLFNNLG